MLKEASRRQIRRLEKAMRKGILPINRIVGVFPYTHEAEFRGREYVLRIVPIIKP